MGHSSMFMMASMKRNLSKERCIQCRIHGLYVKACPAGGGWFVTSLPPKGKGLLSFEISIHRFENEIFTTDTDSIDPLIQSQNELQSDAGGVGGEGFCFISY